MASVGTIYLKSIHNRFAFLAAWLPNASLRLGDVGVRQGDQFKQVTTLQALGIPFRVRRGKSAVDFKHTSESGVTVKARGAAEAAVGASAPLGQAGVSIQFSGQGAFLFEAVGCRTDEIEDKAAVGRAVLEMARRQTWDSDWAVVDTLVSAESATIVVSNSASASLELTAKAPVAAAGLAEADAGIAVASQSGDLISFVAAKGLTPLFRLSRVKQSLLAKLTGGPITFGGPAVEEEPAPDEEALEQVGP